MIFEASKETVNDICRLPSGPHVSALPRKRLTNQYADATYLKPTSGIYTYTYDT